MQKLLNKYCFDLIGCDFCTGRTDLRRIGEMVACQQCLSNGDKLVCCECGQCSTEIRQQSATGNYYCYPCAEKLVIQIERDDIPESALRQEQRDAHGDRERDAKKNGDYE